MQGSEDEMPGGGGLQGDGDGFQVAHLAHQDHVRIFSQRCPQATLEAVRMGAHLALVDQTAFAGMHEFDGILDGENMVLPLLVGQVDDGRQGG